MAYRIGQGVDRHRLVPGRRLVLGGVEIPWERGLLGHSDADVVCHALGNALLGALGAGDIGQLFPDDDPRYRDASSLELLRAVAALVRDKGYRVVNADVTIMAQEPRLAPYRAAMAENVARALGVKPQDVNVKATTGEGMGFAGRAEGMEASCVVLLDSAP